MNSLNARILINAAFVIGAARFAVYGEVVGVILATLIGVGLNVYSDFIKTKTHDLPNVTELQKLKAEVEDLTVRFNEQRLAQSIRGR